MTKFVGVFRELASFNELLHTQVELILVERLHRNWLKVSALVASLDRQCRSYAAICVCCVAVFQDKHTDTSPVQTLIIDDVCVNTLSKSVRMCVHVTQHSS